MKSLYHLTGVPLMLHLGVGKEERKNKQKVLVDFSFRYETRFAAKSDDIADTVDYFEIYQFIQHFPEDREYCLIERLHAELLVGIEKKFPDIEVGELSITKFPFEAGSVSIQNK